ncbi:MAG: hypothetical protein JO247_09420, partial [Chloroflexi bacterium]|nr:hypothetical protein [Chloroflexota bacterium]
MIVDSPPLSADELVLADQARTAGAPTRRRTLDWPVLGGIVLAKGAVFLVVFLAFKLMPFFAAQYQLNFVDPTYRDVNLAAALSTWDAQHYLYLSENGYQPGQESNAFFPLLPALIHVAAPLFGSSLVAGLVVCNVASLVGLYLMFAFIRDKWGHSLARETLVLFLALPTAFFFSLVYSESIFLLLSVLFFIQLYRNRLGWAALPAALLPLARPAGALVLLPFAAYYLANQRPLMSRRALWLAAPFAGAGVYLLIMWLSTGNPLALVSAESVYVSGYSILNILHPVQLWQQLFHGPLAIHGYTDSMIDRAVFAAFLALLLPLFRRLPLPLALFGLGTGLLSVLSGTFMSYSRYVLAAFPLFLAG